jgi:hypothetical protein
MPCRPVWGFSAPGKSHDPTTKSSGMAKMITVVMHAENFSARIDFQARLANTVFVPRGKEKREKRDRDRKTES